jgi:thiamine-phosphate pyrophosphorylase
LLLYYITERSQFPGGEAARRGCLLRKIGEAARCGVDYVQLREKDLGARELESLAREVVSAIRENSAKTSDGECSTRLLINSRTDIALAVGADGVHLRSADISPCQVRELWNSAQAACVGGELQIFPIIAVSCHSDAAVARAAAQGADLAVLAPVFEKRDIPEVAPTGLELLRRACRHAIPVLALGGVTLETIPACLNSGAAGIASIRLFQENDIAEVAGRLRGH